MKSPIAKFIVVTLLLGMLSPAFAGPMRELLRERAAQRRAANAGPVSVPAGVQAETNIAYGPDPAQRLDVYRPEHAANAPVIFMVHGGGWARGDKEAGGVVTNKVAHWVPQGYVFVSVGYRLVPEVDPLVEADDVARALAFEQGKAAGWGADPSRFVLMGHSAGAHLVTLLSADPGIAARQGAKPWLGTVALDSAAYDVVEIMQARHFPLYDKAFGNNRDLWRDASPTLRLKGAPVPMLLVCSSRRADSCAQAEGFADKAKALGGRITVAPVDMRHGEINAQLGASGALTNQVDAFLRSIGLK